MPWTLWRYTFVELWRVVIICTSILVSVIAFAAAAKPLAEGALTPLGAIRFMLLAVPPMLAFALPFAAGFGASLAYHRMAQDNETVAAHSGGVSHRAVLVPAVLSGILMAGGMVGLNEWIIPRFLHAMERMITLDVAQIMIHKIDRGQAADLNNVMIYAERIDQIDPPENSAAQKMFLLHNVAAIQLDDEGGVAVDATVRQAWIVLAPDPDDPSATLCGMQFKDGVGFRVDRGLQRVDSARPEPIPIPDAFEDDPKFLTFNELRALRHNPDGMGFINVRRLHLAQRLAMSDLHDRLDRELGRAGRLKLLGHGGSRYEISADEAAPHESGAWFLSRDDGQVRVRRFEPDADGEMRISVDTADEVWLRLEHNGLNSEPVWGTADEGLGLRFTLQLVNVQTESAGGIATERPRRDYTGLRLLNDPFSAHAAKTSAGLLAEVEARRGNNDVSDAITLSADDLVYHITKLNREITSKQQERMAMAASCFIMVILGSISALRHRDSLPLVVYLWSFFPALVMILLISSGQQETHGNSVAVGVPILWSGVAAGAGVVLISFFKLARH